MPVLKAGEREAIAAWWDRNPLLQGVLAGLVAGVLGILGGIALGSFIFAFIDLN